ncbi:phenylalanyl-tRNA synthetase alpha chain [Wickerhamomyces ciferrii]|uniref:Phenylalanine--tRNA ligase, mitochondrial n=1 Tax=Wickerhamomyces ciferrii (strain ATCC 14091 / BCRC 22168 / CBS 111 / JCM 3599 / NBRC 0793 / NRRL Y-1031 F-60-10) TaxID=1206466 RepID=K0KWX6_WICCF|nr:phenylalanyl-tRNA synthetase alpha chain [Wickerhamomyces ciferrii]CCH45989.1 phenylalanyl-tRNA synthetase alpha chain [Wickerhamomyces ciferrii]
MIQARLLILEIDGKTYKTDEWTNVTPSILGLTQRQLHLNNDHPIGILRNLIENRFKDMGYTFYNQFKPVVTTQENFDSLGFPEDHPGRSKTDTYYINKSTLLRTHTSAHENECFQKNTTPGYFISADVYRRDEIDRTHYPAFHQMEGARIWSKTEHGDNLIAKLEEDISEIPQIDIIVEDPNPPYHPKTNPKQSHMTDKETELVGLHLKKTLELLVNEVFNEAKKSAKLSGNKEPYLNEPLKVRWVEAYFPWTTPSWEIEVFWKGEWLECCGCGVVQEQVLTNSGIENHIGWAFGIGLDRIAMLLFGIPDIRLFWTLDERFAKQFSQGEITTFKPYSKYPGTLRDVSFWIPSENSKVHINDLMEIVRDIAGDLVENVSLVDEFKHPKTGRISQCYRINYQSMDRSLTNDEVNVLQDQIRDTVANSFDVELR